MKGCSQGPPNLKSNCFSLVIIHISDDSLLQATVGKLDVSANHINIIHVHGGLCFQIKPCSQSNSDTSDASLEKSLMRNKKESFPFIGVVL